MNIPELSFTYCNVEKEKSVVCISTSLIDNSVVVIVKDILVYNENVIKLTSHFIIAFLCMHVRVHTRTSTYTYHIPYTVRIRTYGFSLFIIKHTLRRCGYVKLQSDPLTLAVRTSVHDRITTVGNE